MPKEDSNDWYEDHKCPGCGKIKYIEYVQENAVFDRTVRRCAWCGWTEED
jgi:hypothetical protein